MNPAGGTEATTVTLNESGTAAWDMATLEGGTLIPVGSYTVTALYLGDDEYYSEATGTNTFAVEKASSTSAISSSSCPSSVVAGSQSFSVSVRWTNNPTATGAVEPTDQVILYANPYSGSSITGTGTLSQGIPGVPSTATIKITLTAAGQYTVTAAYQGDANYSTSTSEQCVITVTKPT